ncbi:MAG: TetR/AcrR family transcriptional regulator [Oscillospiraceae bacterium]|nr:TetR/AcrR family transcriptional regulator [Oscillospiraceae bacterium]
MAREVDIGAHKIMQMDAGKRERVINAALVEFRNGFGHSSTDAIVREAGISKGLLYHYFGTKEGLYEFLLFYALDVMRREYFSLLNFGERDVLERLRQMILLKWDLSYKHPALFDFMIAAYAREREDPSDQFSAVYAEIQSSVAERLFSDIDTALFREDVDAQKAVNVIQWSLVGYSDSQISGDKSLEDYQKDYGVYLAELDGYFAMFRKIFYKEVKL